MLRLQNLIVEENLSKNNIKKGLLVSYCNNSKLKQIQLIELFK